MKMRLSAISLGGVRAVALFAVWGWMGMASFAEPYVIPLYPTAWIGEATTAFYQSESLGEDALQLDALHPERIALRNWSTELSIVRFDGGVDIFPTEARPESPARVAAASARDRFQLRLAYTGSLNLTTEQLRAVIPQVLFLPTSRSNPEPPNRRNVLIVMLDTLRQDHTSAYGHAYALTPHLDVVRYVGARFNQAYATSSSTRPSCGSLMTGFYPLAHGSVRSCTTPAILYPGAPRIAETFQRAGYRTGGFYANGQVSAGCGFGVGFDTYEGPILSTRTLSWIDATDDPWFVYAHYIAPHHPYEPPPPYDTIFTGQTEDEEHDRYLGEIALEDRRVGELLAGIATRGLWNDTLVWIVTDHGEEFWEHEWKWHGASLYEEVTRAVSLVSCPWLTPFGLEIEEPESLVDMPGTLREVFGLETQTADQGLSVAGLLRGASSETHINRTLYMQLYAGIEAKPHRGDRQGLLRRGSKSIWRTTLDTYERFDLTGDPGETSNLWARLSTPREDVMSELRGFMLECEEYAVRFQEREMEPLPEMSPEDLENIGALGYTGESSVSHNSDMQSESPEPSVPAGASRALPNETSEKRSSP